MKRRSLPFLCTKRIIKKNPHLQTTKVRKQVITIDTDRCVMYLLNTFNKAVNKICNSINAMVVKDKKFFHKLDPNKDR